MPRKPKAILIVMAVFGLLFVLMRLAADCG